MFNFKSSRINTKKVLGQGSLGPVHPYQKNEDDDRWVVKIQSVFPHQLPTKIQEIVLGFSFDHPNVLPIKGFHIEYSDQKTKWDVYLKMPRMEETLHSKLVANISANKYFLDKDIIRYFYDIACGLEYLHQRKIVHRDIKLNNIFLDKNGSAVISDIALGKLIDMETSVFTKDRIGSFGYMAPEMQDSKDLFKKDALYKADAWSLGMAIAELCLLKTDIVNPHLSGEEKEKKLAEQLESLRGMYHDSSFIDLVLMLLKCNPEKRISIQDVKQKLEEMYQEILDSSSPTKLARISESFGVKKGFETPLRRSMIDSPLPRSTAEVAWTESDPQIWRDRLKIVEKELEETKQEFLKFKKERLQGCKLTLIVQDLEASTTFTFGGQKLFTYEESLYENLSGVLIRPKDPSKITDHDIKTLIQCFTKKLDQLNWNQCDLLRLHLTNCVQITDKSFIESSLEIGTRLTNLKLLQINLYNCKNITDTGVIVLAEQIGSKLKALERLILNFGCPNITDNGAKQFINHVAHNLNGLQNLFLGLNKCKISDITINEMIKYLPSYFKNLKGLYIYLSRCINITEDTVIQLVNQVAINLQDIQTFELDLSDCNISDEILCQLIKHLGNNFKNLTCFGLFVNNCTTIKDATISELVQKISFKNIRKLKLGLVNCIQISEQTIKNIGLMIEINMKKLQNLSLGLNGISLSNANKSLLRENLKFIPKLELDF